MPANRSSGSKSSKTLTRMSSARFKGTLMRKSCGGAETKRKVKQLRGDSDERKLKSPVSSRNSKLGNRNSGQRIRDVSVSYSKPNSISGIMLTRKPSLKPVRKLAKMAASKSKKYSMETSEFPESCVEKATCSSAFKGSKFPDHIEHQPGGERESERIGVKKICPYSYCSLHGHSHGNAAPPLKRLKSIRKRALKAQKNKRNESEPLSRAKQSGNRNDGIRASNMVSREVPVTREITDTGKLVSTAVEESDPSILTDINLGEASDSKDKGNFDAGECNSKDTLGSSAFDYELLMERQSEASEKLKGDFVAEIDNLSRTSSSSSISLNITAEVQDINPKYIRMWQLVYKNVVDNSKSGNTDTERPLLQVKETSKEVDNKLLGETNSASFKLLSNVDQEGADVYPDAAAYRKLELFKNEAVKLVQEAFDRILLPEIQGQSPRHCEDNSREKLSGRIQAEVGGSSILISSSRTRSAGEDLSHDPEETQTKVENITAMEEKKTMPTIDNGSTQPAPKRWSNLKKLILLKRFVKALEKVKKINLQKARYVPSELGLEGEKVHLQRQATEERKNSEEWMLDYALQQVISKLEPAEKKRVSLLIEAFETVLPVPGDEAHIRTKTAFPADPHQVHGASDGADKESDRQNGTSETLLEKVSNMKNIVKGPAGQANNITKVEHRNSITFFDKSQANLQHLEKSEQDEAVIETTSRWWRPVGGEIAAQNFDKVGKEATVENCETSMKREGNSYQEVSVNGKILKISERVISRLHSELLNNGDLEQDQTISKNDSLISVTGGESDTISKSLSSEECETSAAAKSLTLEDHEQSTEINTAECSTSAYELLEKARAAIFDKSRRAQSKAGSIQEEYVPQEEIKAASSIGGANETHLEEKKNASMWSLIFKHMVSSIEAKDGSEPPVDEVTDKDGKEFSPRKLKMEMEDSFVNDPDVQLQCIEAVKLVNEAIDEIPLPESNDASRDRSLSATFPEEKGHEVSEFLLPLANNSEKHASADRRREGYDATAVSNPDDESVRSVDVNIQEEEKEQSLGSKPNQQVLKNWSNLKKVILLRRFIKAMEKVKKFNPRRPRFLPLVQDAESEKVQLRHQDTEDRKNADEWMLDYALQQAVAKLTPARKRKVELLVQAFETVK